MSTNFIMPVKLLNQNVSSGSVQSTPMDLLTLTGAALQIIWAGNLAGTLSIVGSIDGINYSDIGASIPSQPNGSPGNVLLNLVDLQFRYVAVAFQWASGSGNLSVLGEAKRR